MTLEADESAPFRYHCTQSVSIAGDRVSIELSARNLSAQRIPLGFGLHPYFANRADATVKAEVPALWRWDHEMMPVDKEPNPDAARFSRGLRVRELPITAEYADWDGGAVIEWPTMRLRVQLQTDPPLKHVVVWMPAGKDFFCFEPVSHATDGLNGQFTQGPGADFFVLEPDESAEQRFDFIVSSGELYPS